MLDEDRAPRMFWPEAMNTACYVSNRIYLKVHKKKNNYELMQGRTPKVSHFHVFGCKCFISTPKKNETKTKFSSYFFRGLASPLPPRVRLLRGPTARPPPAARSFAVRHPQPRPLLHNPNPPSRHRRRRHLPRVHTSPPFFPLPPHRDGKRDPPWIMAATPLDATANFFYRVSLSIPHRPRTPGPDPARRRPMAGPHALHRRRPRPPSSSPSPHPTAQRR
jgi:hypothetical protein